MYTLYGITPHSDPLRAFVGNCEIYDYFYTILLPTKLLTPIEDKAVVVLQL